MKGTVPNHDQPVVMPNLDFNLDQTATGQTKQQVAHPGSRKVYTSFAFLGLAVASGILMPKTNDRVMATELSDPPRRWKIQPDKHPNPIGSHLYCGAFPV